MCIYQVTYDGRHGQVLHIFQTDVLYTHCTGEYLGIVLHYKVYFLAIDPEFLICAQCRYLIVVTDLLFNSVKKLRDIYVYASFTLIKTLRVNVLFMKNIHAWAVYIVINSWIALLFSILICTVPKHVWCSCTKINIGHCLKGIIQNCE